MRHTTIALALMSAAVLSACGGGGSAEPGDQTLKTKFSSEVVFGDSLSDVGTYKVGTVAALKGGKFNINNDNTAVSPTLTGLNYTELLSVQLGLPVSCAAYTGLNGVASQGFSVPTTYHAGCTNYAQGGSRVTNPVGNGNIATGSPLGALTVPVVTQIQNHLSVSSGKFSGTELVIVMAGANDILLSLQGLSTDATAAGTTAFGTSLVGQLAAGATNPATAAGAIGLALQTESARAGHTDASVVQAAVTAAVMAGNTNAASPAVYGPMVATAQAAGAKAGADYFAANGPKLVPAMAAVAGELVAQVETQIVGKGANYVVVNNVPDIATTPFGLGQSADTRALIDAMVKAFNDKLASGLAADTKVVYVDAYAASHDQATNPAPYGLTNVTTPACDLRPAVNPLASSLGCNASNVIAGDISHYSFADSLHPTPFVQLLLARYVSKYLVQKGWI
jgi:outer membrane lipase/esterase